MLQKSKSKQVWQFKYSILVPLVLGMLIYSSCENEETEITEQESSISSQVEQLKATIAQKENMTEQEKKEIMTLREIVVVGYGGEASRELEDKFPEVDYASSKIDVPFAVVEEVPVFPGCENAADPRACFQEQMQRHVRKYFRYPEEAQEQGMQGRVSIMFTIDTEGNIVKIRKRGPSPLLEDEAVRIIEKLPKMAAPGKQKGKPVDVPFSIPITFKMQ